MSRGGKERSSGQREEAGSGKGKKTIRGIGQETETGAEATKEWSEDGPEVQTYPAVDCRSRSTGYKGRVLPGSGEEGGAGETKPGVEGIAVFMKQMSSTG